MHAVCQRKTADSCGLYRTVAERSAFGGIGDETTARASLTQALTRTLSLALTLTLSLTLALTQGPGVGAADGTRVRSESCEPERTLVRGGAAFRTQYAAPKGREYTPGERPGRRENTRPLGPGVGAADGTRTRGLRRDRPAL